MSWQERKFFVPDFVNATIHEKSWDDFQSSCYTKSGDPHLAKDPKSNWKGYEVTKDGVINFEIEQEYSITNDEKCLFDALGDSNLDMEDLSFTVSRFYSLVPLDLVRSPSLSTGKSDAYEPIVYQRGDEDTFGFFANKRGRPDVAYVGGQFDQSFEYLHRFNPKLKSLDYHLSDSFNLNEDTLFFKQITKEVIAKINPQLKRVGVPPIRLIEPSGKQPGDLRYNVINLIDEPLDNGLAGYGPTAVNPLTGEIVHAHVNQYAGVLRSIADRLWNRIATDYNQGRIAEKISAPKINTEANVTGSETTSNELNIAASPIEINPTLEEQLSSMPMAQETKEQAIKAYGEELSQIDINQPTVKQLAALRDLEARLWSENNMYSVNNLRAGATLKTLPTRVGDITFDYRDKSLWRDESKIGEPGYLKKWDELPEGQKAKLSKFLAGAYYTKTLVHELGHNLGLRHNFKGSNDESNYFKESELAAHGLKTVPGYSSIMDYNPSMLNALPVYGPYDLAALRFGYSRKVETNQTTFSTTNNTAGSGDAKSGVQSNYLDVSQLDEKLRNEVLSDNPQLSDDIYDGVIKGLNQKLANGVKLREFKFCTDENVSLNEDCNRHDEGRNRGEIAAFKQEQYDDEYYQRTTRGMKKNFSEDTIMSYANSRISTFMDWRNSIQNFDRWREFMSANFQDDLMRLYAYQADPYCNDESNVTEFTYEMFCGSPRAVDSVRDKLVDILLTPEHTCELKNKADETYSYRSLAKIIGEYKYRDNFPINHVPESCFDEGVIKTLAQADPNLVVTGESGKYLNSGSAPRPAPVNNYSNYIDYIGHWPDRLAAAATLVDRIGMRNSTERSTMALFDLPTVKVINGTPRIYNTKQAVLDTIIKGSGSSSYPFRDAEGNYYQVKGDFTAWSWDQKIERMPLYGSYSIRDYYGLPKYEQVPLNKAILTAMVKHSAGNMVNQKDEAFARSITMRSEPGWQQNTLSYVRNNGKTYYAAPDNAYAQDMILFTKDIDALYNAEKAGKDLSEVALNAVALTDYQDPAKKVQMLKQYLYQKQSLENLPVYNTKATLDDDLLNH